MVASTDRMRPAAKIKKNIAGVRNQVNMKINHETNNSQGIKFD